MSDVARLAGTRASRGANGAHRPPAAGLVLAAVAVLLTVLAGCSGGGSTPRLEPAPQFQTAATDSGSASTIYLEHGRYNQWLVPVQIGNQTLKLLLDTGSTCLVVFRELIADSNTAVEFTGNDVQIAYASATRKGHLATAPVRIGDYRAESMSFLAQDTPTQADDPSLNPKRADGILGMRFQPGLESILGLRPDIPLLTLRPQIRQLEITIDPLGQRTLTLGGQPTIGAADPHKLVTCFTTTELGPDRVRESYADLEVPFRIASSAGTAASDTLDILLDTGAVSRLILDIAVAETIGYSAASRAWSIPADEELDLHLIGYQATLPITPRFKVSEVRVEDLSGTTFDAVLGIDRWQSYVVGFEFVDWTLGGPEGTLRFLTRSQMAEAQYTGWPTDGYVALNGLNSTDDDAAPVMNQDGSLIVFDSDRAGSLGLRDIYAYRVGQGLVDLSALNSTSSDEAPAVSADGSLIAFTSDRPGGAGDWDIYLYDLNARAFVALPGLNTTALERTPALSPDGRYVTFRSERAPDYLSAIYVYDRQTQALLDTPGLGGDSHEYTSRISGTGLVAYCAEHRAGGAGLSDIHLYDLNQKREIPLSAAVNSATEDWCVSLTADGRYLAFQTDRYPQSRSAVTTDIAVYDLGRNGTDGRPGVAVETPGLNLSLFEDSCPALSGDGRWMALSSNRAGGAGSLDIYLYQMPTAAGR